MKDQYKKDTIKRLWCQLISVQDFDELRIDENGWCDWRCRQYMDSKIWPVLISKLKQGRSRMSNGADLLYRPMSLNGIENNNGWNRIDNPSDLPQSSGMYIFLVDKKEFNLWYESGIGMSLPKSSTHWREIIDTPIPLY